MFHFKLLKNWLSGKTTDNPAFKSVQKPGRRVRVNDVRMREHQETPAKQAILVGHGCDVSLTAHHGKAVSVDRTRARALVKDYDTLAVAVGRPSLLSPLYSPCRGRYLSKIDRAWRRRNNRRSWLFSGSALSWQRGSSGCRFYRMRWSCGEWR